MKLTSAIGMAFGAALAATGAVAADFPERPINLIAPFNAGGGTDLLLRGLAPHFEEAVGENVFVSNMSGGSGTVAASALQGQKPTGYQMAYMSITVSTIQPQIKNVPYGVDSWTPICSIAASPTMLFVSNDSPFQSMEDVVAAVNAEPGKYVFGSSGPGAITHLSMVSAFSGLDLMDKVKHLPFKGSGPAIKELTAGNIHFFGDTELLMKRGDFRPLMVFNAERLDSFPDVPTATEVGIAAPLNELYLWGGLFAPAGLEQGTVDVLAKACDDAVHSDGFQEFANNSGTVINHRGPEEFNAFFRAQYDANKALISAAGL
ncbi:tripartite tricarboxylate transporter substrate binding protein [Cognatishimia activa]|uniref:Tripartite tricarboxylate transporter family receptor n=1 Tax=Cognatishimia activa TaxID=1715691 RepID=A0A0P1IRW1_9RHOB|nr:tripartite tricarboxylate transporter substrate binding protein [Cognatishimia activa]CUJ00954.1 Tripartite tricarboxylate transporter family receptor [Cognatishimia activa]CUK26189.1 Tripartite tricarboxylate transporter family receptor [Cognatishimia activa]